MFSQIVKYWLLLVLLFPAFIFWSFLIFSGFSLEAFLAASKWLINKYFAATLEQRQDFWLFIIKSVMLICFVTSLLTSLLITTEEEEI